MNRLRAAGYSLLSLHKSKTMGTGVDWKQNWCQTKSFMFSNIIKTFVGCIVSVIVADKNGVVLSSSVFLTSSLVLDWKIAHLPQSVVFMRFGGRRVSEPLPSLSIIFQDFPFFLAQIYFCQINC